MTETLYNQLETSLENTRSTIFPSEAQGALCGMLSLSTRLDVDAWMAFILDQVQNNSQSSYRQSLEADLSELEELTVNGFSPHSGGMTLLLPSDEAPLQERLEALAAWCEGFLYGIGISGMNDSDTIPENSREFITDIREIGKLDPESHEEDAEYYYMELVEYIRVGLLVFREEMLPASAAQTQPLKTTH